MLLNLSVSFCGSWINVGRHCVQIQVAFWAKVIDTKGTIDSSRLQLIHAFILFWSFIYLPYDLLNMLAAWSNKFSSNWLAINWTPIGRLFESNPIGILIAGIPAKFADVV